ncbi:MAG: SseB family protein [Lachnospiraceae bacterium]|nr:SseB family protein [Lachnospiraceae bacterium]
MSENNNNERRFTLLSNEVKNSEEGGILVTGILHGAICKGDRFFIYHPQGKIVHATAEALYNADGEEIENALNSGAISIRIPELKEAGMLPRYTALTSIEPQAAGAVGTATENPQLLTFVRDITVYGGDKDFINIIIYLACHGRFVIPAMIEGPEPQPVNGRFALPPGSRMSFPMLTQKENPEARAFPIFTDMKELDRWKDLFNKDHPQRIVVLPFNEIVKASQGNDIIINAFSDAHMVLNKAMIQKIVSMKGFQDEFGSPADAKTADGGANIKITLASETEEVRCIKEAMIEYAMDLEYITRIDLCEKHPESGDASYLCIVDCPDSRKEEVFAGIREACLPKMEIIKNIDFMLYAGNKIVDKLGKAQTVVFVR